MKPGQMKLIHYAEEGMENKRWRLAVICGKDPEGGLSWFPAPEIYTTREEAIKDAAVTYPKRELILD